MDLVTLTLVHMYDIVVNGNTLSVWNANNTFYAKVDIAI